MLKTKLNQEYCHCERSRAIHPDTSPMSFPRRRESSGRSPHNEFLIPGSSTRKGMTQSVCQGQSGRSMVEMLGTLAIVGVLSAGAIGGYSYAMNKHRTNELIYEATKRAQWVGTQLEMNNPNPSLNTFGTDSFGGGRFTGEVVQLENGQIGIKVAGLKEAVCQNILNSIGDNTVIREMKDVHCNDDNGTATLIFNRDLSTSDPTEIPEVSGEASDSATAAAPATTTGPSDRVTHCNDHGDWDGNSCDCDAGYEGETCSVEINAQPDEPEETEAAICGEYGHWNGYSCTCDSNHTGVDCSISVDTSCNGHGTWTGYRCDCESGWYGFECSTQDFSSACSGHGEWYSDGGGLQCHCSAGWGGADCSQNARTACSEHGVWIESTNHSLAGGYCECDSGWAGTTCSQGEICGNHGSWNSGNAACRCMTGWGGTNCSIQNPCNGHGEWHSSYGRGRCYCNSNWGGTNCSLSSQEVCSGNGNWDSYKQKCSCNSGYIGADCSEDDPESTSTDYTPESTNG